jgi:hypothetical protein
MEDVVKVVTMQGLGDAFASRPTIAALVERHGPIYIETCWPQVFSDFRARGLAKFLAPEPTPLRAQKRNAMARSSDYFDFVFPKTVIRLGYSTDGFRTGKTIPDMIAESAGVEPRWDMFRHQLWRWEERHALSVGVYRLPTVRTEYHNTARNPAPGIMPFVMGCIANVFKGIDWVHFNDLWEGETLAEEDITGGAKITKGEWGFDSIFSFMERAVCVVSPVSWMAWAAACIGAPTVCVSGGYANPRQIFGSLGMKCNNFAVLVPDPFCACLDPVHECRKTITLDTVGAMMKMIVKSWFDFGLYGCTPRKGVRK